MSVINKRDNNLKEQVLYSQPNVLRSAPSIDQSVNRSCSLIDVFYILSSDDNTVQYITLHYVKLSHHSYYYTKYGFRGLPFK